MSINRNSIARRDVLKGGAAAVGTALIGRAGLAKALSGAPQAVAVYFLAGETWVEADRVNSANSPLDRVRIQIKGNNSSGDFTMLEAIFNVQTSSGSKPCPFRAWVPGAGPAKFEMPVDPDAGLRFVLTRGATTKDIALKTSPHNGYRLRAGSYLVVDSKTSVASFDPASPESFPAPYVLLNIEAA